MTAPSFEDDLHGAFRNGYYPDHLGIQLVDWEKGVVRLHLSAEPRLLRNYGVVEGGALAALADVGMAWAVLSAVHPSACPTITLQHELPRPGAGVGPLLRGPFGPSVTVGGHCRGIGVDRGRCGHRECRRAFLVRSRDA